MASVRRLSAIMFTDMVGSTASAQADERQALKLRDEQAGIVRPLFTAHQGREVKSMGDGFLAEFDSALRAVQCAIDIQHHLHERNSQPGVAPIQLRIGIHLGDVEQRADDIFGDAVNIAARIEPLATPGGICISGEVCSQIRNKIPNAVERLPSPVLKGLQASMDIYRVDLPWVAREMPSSGNGPTRIAVLPFTNMSPDPADSYFADGLTEELITVLSQIKDLRVIARTSIMQYKSTTKAIPQIGTELGVSSILEGSVRRGGNRLRITAQLIAVSAQEHVWAKSYDREVDDVFVVQTEIAKQVAEALQIELRPADEARLDARRTVRQDSYLAYLKGRALFNSFSRSQRQAAKQQFELAISLDPTNAAAYSGLADAIEWLGTGWEDRSSDQGGTREEWVALRRGAVARALAIDPDLAEAHASLAQIQQGSWEQSAAEKEFKVALSLNPSYSFAHHWYAEHLEDNGRIDEALQEWELAEAADPLATAHLEHFAELLIWLGRLDEAQTKIRRIAELEPENPNLPWIRADYLLAKPDLEEYLKGARQLEDAEPKPRWRALLRAVHCALSGDNQQARTLLQGEESLPATPSTDWGLAWAYAELRDADRCYHWLERAVDAHAVSARRIRLDPRFDHIRRDPRFPRLLKKMNVAWP